MVRLVRHGWALAALLCCASSGAAWADGDADPTRDASGAEAPDAETPAYVVIVHPTVEREQITVDELRAIALGRQRYWKSGAPIQLVLEVQGSATRAIWVESIARMSPVQFVHYWIGATFQGRAVTGPRAVQGSRSAVQLVAALPGAIGIVPAEAAEEALKQLTVSPDPSSPLHSIVR